MPGLVLVQDMPLVHTLPVTGMWWTRHFRLLIYQQAGFYACCVFAMTCSKGTLILLLETYWLAEHQHLEIMVMVLQKVSKTNKSSFEIIGEGLLMAPTIPVSTFHTFFRHA